VETWLVKFYKAQISATGQTLNLSVAGKDTSQIIETIVQECLQTLMICKKGE
jgi:hypothetical protein